MLTLRSAIVLSMLVASTAMSHAEEFPTAPSKLKDAEAQGLVRMSAQELREFLPGQMEMKGVKGRHTKTFNPDGSAYRTGIGDKEASGTWRFDDKNNAYCNTFQEKKGPQEYCFAVFRAPDGVHNFSYEIDTGFYAHVWRRAKKD